MCWKWDGHRQAEGDRAAKGSVVVGLGRATVPAFLLRCRLGHPECYGGAAALHRSAPGAAVHLPLPLQVRAVPGAGGRVPAPGLGTLPSGVRAPQDWGLPSTPPSLHPAT